MQFFRIFLTVVVTVPRQNLSKMVRKLLGLVKRGVICVKTVALGLEEGIIKYRTYVKVESINPKKGIMEEENRVLRKIQQLEEKKLRLEENLFTVGSFDLQFKIQKQIEQIEDKIEELEFSFEDDVERISVVVEIPKGTVIDGKKIPIYICFSEEGETTVALWSDLKLIQGESVRAEILGYIEELKEPTLMATTGPEVTESNKRKVLDIMKNYS